MNFKALVLSVRLKRRKAVKDISQNKCKYALIIIDLGSESGYVLL